MRNLALRAAVLSTLGQIAIAGSLGMVSTQASADWMTLPTAGFTISTPSTNQPTGTTAYVRCNTTGNYGSADTTRETATNTAASCHVKPTTGSRNDSPVSTVATTMVTTVRPLVLNNSYTGNTNITVGEVEERVWRNGTSNSTATQCVYGLRLSLYDVDYDTTQGGVQHLELNGFARGGFSSFTGTTTGKFIKAGYYHSTVTDEATFRLGRAFTSVQPRADQSDITGETFATGYVHRPLTTPAPATGTAVNGVSTYDTPLVAPTAGQQSAAIRTNWVEFTTDNNFEDDDGTSKPDSSQFYVWATGTGTGANSGCPALDGSGNPILTSNAYRFRQVGQEEAPLFEFPMSGYVPNGGNTNY